MKRSMFYLMAIALCGCTPTSTLLSPDPRFPPAPTYKEYMHQNLMIRQGRILAHFPGLLDCTVNALNAEYTPAEMTALDTYARTPTTESLAAAIAAEKSRADRVHMDSDEYAFRACAHIRADKGVFAGAEDYIIQFTDNSDEAIFQERHTPNDIRAAFDACNWKITRAILTDAEFQELDTFAKGQGDISWTTVAKISVSDAQLNATCPDVTAKMK